MLATLFIILCAAYGVSLIRFLIPDIRRFMTAVAPSKSIVGLIPDLMFTLPAGTVIGLMTVSSFLYYLTSLMNKISDNIDLVRKSSIAATIAVFVLLMATNLIAYFKKKKEPSPMIPEYKNTVFNMFFYGISTLLMTLTAAFLMFYTFRVSSGYLLTGYTTFSDMAPHVAMTSSFGVGHNFPTQYMHYSGDGIQYHFFFYFLCGTLEYLGWPIDFAINIPSIIVMVCGLTLAGFLAVILSRRRSAFLITPILILFRSSFNFVYQMKELLDTGIGLRNTFFLIFHNVAWYAKTPYDAWGIWSVNVYANQRHLMLGVSCILILVILFIPFMRRMCISIIKAQSISDKIMCFIGTRNSWLLRENDPLDSAGILILASILVTVMPFFHGSALIAALLVLMFMAVLSESRLIYACVALCAVISSYIQTRLFAGSVSKVIMLRYNPGFILTDRTPPGVVNYIVTVTGLTIILAFIYVIYHLVRDIVNKTPVYRFLLFICFMAPLVFAFLYTPTLEPLANHKFVQVSLILLDVFVGGLIGELLKLPLPKNENGEHIVPKGGRIALNAVSVLLVIALSVPLTATGVFEWATYLNMNKNTLNADTRSPLVEWIEENTDPGDVFLTPYWSMNRFYLAGRPAYYGWPYYAWSAGHDTPKRELLYSWLVSGCNNNADEFVRYCRERGIRYVIDDPEFSTVELKNGFTYDPEFFAANLTQAAYFPEDNGTIVYRVY